MSKKKVQKAAEELLSWLPNYNWEQRAEMMEIIGRMLASLPGGDQFEDLGYEPYSAMGWKEFEMISNVLAAVDDRWDVEHLAEMFFADEEEDDDY